VSPEADWLATSSCHWCGHMRKRHNDGPCSGDYGSPCNCRSFCRSLSAEEARVRWVAGEGAIPPLTKTDTLVFRLVLRRGKLRVRKVRWEPSPQAIMRLLAVSIGVCLFAAVYDFGIATLNALSGHYGWFLFQFGLGVWVGALAIINFHLFRRHRRRYLDGFWRQ
jgi:hypothetical protein